MFAACYVFKNSYLKLYADELTQTLSRPPPRLSAQATIALHYRRQTKNGRM